MLETTLSTTFRPATNLTRELSLADWRFLLPDIDLGTVAWLGAPTIDELQAAARMVRTVVVVATDEAALRRLSAQVSSRRLLNVLLIKTDGDGAVPLGRASVHAVIQRWPASGGWPSSPAATVRWMAEALRLDGVYYVELCGMQAWLAHRLLERTGQDRGLETLGAYWLTPLKGEFRTAMPMADRRLATYAFRHVLYGQSFRKRILSAAGRLFGRSPLPARLWPHRAVALGRTGSSVAVSPVPGFIRGSAADSGIDLSGCRFGLSARGKSNANKLIFYLIEKDAKRPGVVVKMTRAREFNHRLENEYRALQTLQGLAGGRREDVPIPLFLGRHKGLAFIGLQAVDGRPFRTRTSGKPNCPLALQAAAWLRRLGAGTPRFQTAPAAKVGRVLDELFDRFDAVYRPAEKYRRFLSEQIEGLRRSGVSVPQVFQHGDPGTWNILVTGSGRVVFIDWEAAEAKGMPLWDLFYFMRSHGSWVMRTRGSRHAGENFRRQFVESSEMSELLTEFTRRCCADVGLDRSLVKPLFYTCWMHRALKESTRLRHTALDSGTYFNLIKLCVDQVRKPGLAALFGER